MTQFKNIFLLILIVSISACGYQLRGKIDLPEGLKSIYLQGGSSQLKKVVKKTLRSSGGQLVDAIGDAGLIIDIVKEKMDRRVMSLSSTGRANEYELIYKLDFTLLDKEGKALSKLQRIEISKHYFNNQDEVLGKNNEEEVIRDEMYRKSVQSIVNRSRIVLEKLENEL